MQTFRELQLLIQNKIKKEIGMTTADDRAAAYIQQAYEERRRQSERENASGRLLQFDTANLDFTAQWWLGSQASQSDNAPEASSVKMDSDLMVLVNACETPTQLVESQKTDDAVKLAKRLSKLGFKKAASPITEKASIQQKMSRITAAKFIIVKPENIHKFLAKLATEYNEKYGNKEKVTSHYAKGVKLSAPTCHSQSMKGIGKFEWEEVAIETYQGIPPTKVLDRFEEVQGMQLFDTFTVATVKAVRDPLLLGRVSGSEDRFFIAQWGDDVSLDDVI